MSDRPKYILQNPVGKVFYLDEVTNEGLIRSDFNTTNPNPGEESGGEDTETSETNQEMFKYYVTKGEIHINGFSELGLTKNIVDIKFPSLIDNLPVTVVDGFSNKNIESVSFSDSVRELKVNAFSNNKLKSVDLNNISIFANGVFANNKDLAKLNINKSIIYKANHSGQYPFEGNKLMNGVVFSDEVKNIPEYFFYKAGITDIDLNKIEIIGGSSFYYNDLSELFIPETVTTIGGAAFRYNMLSKVIADKAPFSINFTGYSEFNNNYSNRNENVSVTYLKRR